MNQIEQLAATADRGGRTFVDGFDHWLFRQLVGNLLEMDYRLEPADWPRWATAAFVNGLRFAHYQPTYAAFLIRGSPSRLLAESEHVHQWLRSPSFMTDSLSVLEAKFTGFTQNPSPFMRAVLSGLSPATQLSRWVVASIVWGIRAGLEGSDLGAGHLIGLVEQLPLGRKFVNDRLAILLPSFFTLRKIQHPALVELITYSYPSQNLERQTLSAAALSVFLELKERGNPLDCSAWVVAGFRDGLRLSTQDSDVRAALFDELAQNGQMPAEPIFLRRLGPNPAGWGPARLVTVATAWLADNHPHVVAPDNRADEFERIRHLFDFAFWMGLVAGGIDTEGSNAG